jgi:Probable lipid transfer
MATLRQLLALLALTFLVLVANSDFTADRAECTDQLMGLATCITFVEGDTTAKNPTPDCCAGFKQVVGKGMKCVCILIKDHDQMELGIKINVSLALELPHKCSAPINVSECPGKLTHLHIVTRPWCVRLCEYMHMHMPTWKPNQDRYH